MKLLLIFASILAVYVVLNIFRLFAHRLNPEYLKHAFVRTTFWLVGLLLSVLLGYLFFKQTAPLTSLYVLAIFQMAAVFVLLISTISNIKSSKVNTTPLSNSEIDLPTVTVCIPARNEDLDLKECLTSILSSDYKKFEIIVLDDCSQDKRTSEIIRDFAQSGVIFVAGENPPNKWLAKNFAYQQLSEAANGQLLLFCGVDCRFEPTTISKLVDQQMRLKLNMTSILPINISSTSNPFGQLLIQPTRYAWELALPRLGKLHNPVLSTCWLIDSDFFHKTGGFNAVRRKCVPESYFATKTGGTSRGYRFIIANKSIGLFSIKSTKDQKETAVRIRYPQLKRRPENVAILSILEFIVLIFPIILLVAAIASGEGLLALISGITVLMGLSMYSLVVNITYRRFILLGVVIMPLAVIYDIILLNVSMWQYEFGKVIWKGRNICLPVLRYPTNYQDKTNTTGSV